MVLPGLISSATILGFPVVVLVEYDFRWFFKSLFTLGGFDGLK